MEKLSN